MFGFKLLYGFPMSEGLPKNVIHKGVKPYITQSGRSKPVIDHCIIDLFIYL